MTTPGYYNTVFLSILKRLRWQDRPPRFVLRTEARVPKARRQAVVKFLAWYRTQFTPLHYVEVGVYAKVRFTHNPRYGRPDAQGIFWYPKNPDGHPYSPKIYIAASLRSTWSVLHTLAHELSHYEEWANTGQSTERGKDAKADRIMGEYGGQGGSIIRGHLGRHHRARSRSTPRRVMPSKLREARQKLGAGTYLTVGIERTRHRPGTTFSMRHYHVTSLTAGWRLLKYKMTRPTMRNREVGELSLWSKDGERRWVLGGFVRREAGRLERYGDQGLVKR